MRCSPPVWRLFLSPSCWPDHKPGALSQLARSLKPRLQAGGYAYVSLGPALPELPESYAAHP